MDVPHGVSAVLLPAPRNPSFLAEGTKFLKRCSVAGQFHQAVSGPLVHRASHNDRVVWHPDDLHKRAASFHLTPLEPLRAVAEKRLAAVLEAPTGLGAAGLNVRAAALSGVECNVDAVGLVLCECERLHVHTGGCLRIELLLRSRKDSDSLAAQFMD